MTPRSSGPGGEYPPLRGTTNLRLTANQHCNVTENCAGVLAAATSPANRVAAQLQTAWVTFGKQTLSTSRKRQRRVKNLGFDESDPQPISRGWILPRTTRISVPPLNIVENFLLRHDHSCVPRRNRVRRGGF